MIRSIRHKGLKRLHADGGTSGVNAEHVDKLRRILARLEAAKVVADLDLPGYRLHALKGDLCYGSTRAERPILIISITTEGNHDHANEKSSPPWQPGAA